MFFGGFALRRMGSQIHQKKLDYIEANISEYIQIEQLANQSDLSFFYYQRRFSRLVKKPVREYTKLRRLARARASLADKRNRILDIALDCGFGSHETFTRAFKGAYRMMLGRILAAPRDAQSV